MRVVIAGGGISGLTLANALDKAGIDFVLLEARSQWDPQVGASIGIGPAALRIFDQVGAAQYILDNTVALQTTKHHRADGSLITPPSPSMLVFKSRFEYGICFLDRQLVLRALADAIRQQDKMLLNKRVASVEHTDTGATVLCEDGSSYTGDVVVGCDGVNSKVRKEMWRIAGEQDPKVFPEKEMTKLSAEFICLFGISTPVEGLEEGDIDTTYDEGKSFLVITGKDRRVFWFFFEKQDKVRYYHETDFPRFSQEDAEKFAEKHAWRPCHEKLKLKDIWANRVSYTLVPMEEALFERWSWGRITTIGDNAHKMTANHGQAGNAAIESAAALANELKKLHDVGDASAKSIDDAFSRWKEKRRPRVEATVKEASDVCRMQSLDSWWFKFEVFVLIPNAADLILNMFTDVFIGGEVLEYLPLPERSFEGTCPFNPRQGVGFKESMLWRLTKALPLCAISYWAAYHARAGTGQDLLLTLLEPASTNAVEWMNAFSVLAALVLIHAVWLIESNRRANFMTLTQLPMVFAILDQYLGLGVAAPWFYVAHYVFATIEKFAASDMRLTNVAYTRTILPIALAALSGPIWMSRIPQAYHSWAPFALPIAISVLQQLLVHSGISTTDLHHDALTNVKKDLPHIRLCIHVLSGVSASLWMAPLFQKLPDVFVQRAGMLVSPTSSIGLVVGATAVWLMLLIQDLKRAGMIDMGWLRIVAAGLIGLAAAGPAAMLAQAWLWREEIIATRREKHARTRERYGPKAVSTTPGADGTHVELNGSVAKHKNANGQTNGRA